MAAEIEDTGYADGKIKNSSESLSLLLSTTTVMSKKGGSKQMRCPTTRTKRVSAARVTHSSTLLLSLSSFSLSFQSLGLWLELLAHALQKFGRDLDFCPWTVRVERIECFCLSPSSSEMPRGMIHERRIRGSVLSSACPRPRLVVCVLRIRGTKAKFVAGRQSSLAKDHWIRRWFRQAIISREKSLFFSQ